MGICSATLVLLLCCAFACLPRPVSSSAASDWLCQFVNCGQGNCTESKGTFLPFDCSCNDGWRKMQMGTFDLPPCVVPNCDLDSGCESPSFSPMEIPPMPYINLTNPCSYTFCGDGTCLAEDELRYECSCNIGSNNMLNFKRLPCIRHCAAQQDCQALRSTSSSSSQSPSSSSQNPSSSSQSPSSSFQSPPPPFLSITVPRTPFYASGCGENCTYEYNFSRKNQAPGLILLIFIFILQV